jgi:hypothetical protein
MDEPTGIVVRVVGGGVVVGMTGRVVVMGMPVVMVVRQQVVTQQQGVG